MDKSTLSNYGWVVIAVLVLSVMIALATPFGEYIRDGVWSTTQGLFDTSENALNTVKHNPLKGRNLAIFGTSISISADTYVTTSYLEAIAEKNSMSIQDYAIGGSSMKNSVVRFRSNKSKLNSFTSDDFVIYEGLFNNWYVPNGVITEIGTTEFDTDTLIGTLEWAVSEYQKSGCKAKFGFIFTHYGNYSSPESLDRYNEIWDAGVLVCEKYNIPYLDLRDKDYPLLTDGIHLTQEGQFMMADDVENWLKTL